MAQNAFDQMWQAAGGRTEMVRLTGGPVHVHRAGSGTPLLCVHGWAMGGVAFAHQLPLAARGFELIALDLPGFSSTQRHEPEATIDYQASVVSAVIRQLGLSDVCAIGWSMGAIILWQMLSVENPAVTRLISIDMTPRIENDHDWSLGLMSGHSAAGRSELLEAMRQDWQAYTRRFTGRILAGDHPVELEAITSLALAADVGVAAESWASMSEFDARPLLGSIMIPTRAVHGARSGLYHQAVAAHVAGAMPDAQAIIIESAGHAPHIETPDIFNRLVADFCAAPATPTQKQQATEAVLP